MLLGLRELLDFEERTHFGGMEQAVEDGLGLRRGKAVAESGGGEAVAEKERCKLFQRVGLQAVVRVFQGFCHVMEIDVHGEIGISRLVEDADLLMFVKGLEGVARRAVGAGAVVEKQSRMEALR